MMKMKTDSSFPRPPVASTPPGVFTSEQRRLGPSRALPGALLPGALLVAGLLSGCGDDETPSPTTPAPAPVPAPTPEPAPPETQSYVFGQPEVRISPRIPGTLPEGVDFAPPLAFVAHARGEAPFAPGELASPGLRVLAETGASELFVEEAEAASATVIASSMAEMIQIFLSPDPSVEMEHDLPCISYAQMIVPSPDWFIGFSNVCATDEDGNWLDAVSAELLAFDAGSAEGGEFEPKSAATEPPEPISLLDRPPYFISPAVVQVLSATRKTE